MTGASLLTAVLSAVLAGLAVTLLYHEWRAEAPPGDRRRRPRRIIGALLLGGLSFGLYRWEGIDPKSDPVFFLNVSAVLLVMVWGLLALGLYDMTAVGRAERHRKLSILTQELYGVSLKEMDEREAESVARDALRRLAGRSGKGAEESGGSPAKER